MRSYWNLNEAIGKNLLPTFTELFDIAAKFFNNLSENHPLLLAVTAGFLLIGFAVSTILVVLGSFLIMAGAVSVAMTVLGVSLGGLVMSFLVIPTIIVLVVAAIAYLGYQIYQFCTGGKNIFSDFTSWVSKVVNDVFGINLPAIFGSLGNLLSSPIESLKNAWAGFLNWFSGTFPAITAMISKLSMGAININPGTAPLGGVTNSKSLQSNFNMTNNIHNHGSKATDRGTVQGITGSVTGMNKVFSQMSGVYQ